MDLANNTFEFQQDNLQRQQQFEHLQQDNLYFGVNARTDFQSLNDLVAEVAYLVGRQDEQFPDHSLSLLVSQRREVVHVDVVEEDPLLGDSCLGMTLEYLVFEDTSSSVQFQQGTQAQLQNMGDQP